MNTEITNSHRIVKTSLELVRNVPSEEHFCILLVGVGGGAAAREFIRLVSLDDEVYSVLIGVSFVREAFEEVR